MPIDTADREDLLDALRVAAHAAADNLGCGACESGNCADPDHAERMRRVRAWRTLAADIGRLPATGDTEPLISFDAAACRAWLQAWAAQDAGIDDGFNSGNYTIAAGVEDLLLRLNNEPPRPGWCTVAHVQDIQIWRTADSDGADGGGILTVHLSYMGQRVSLASLHQGYDEFTDDSATCGIDAAVQALAHVAETLNREYATLRRAGGCLPGDASTAGDEAREAYTVIGVWIDDDPVPVGVVAGEHTVSGGEDFERFPQGVWATMVIAVHDLEAERHAIDQMRADNNRCNDEQAYAAGD